MPLRRFPKPWTQNPYPSAIGFSMRTVLRTATPITRSGRGPMLGSVV
jgi:hypothetical protein